MIDSNFAALQQLHSNLRVAIYCRLSKDDNLDGESASIHNQRDMLETWCQEHGFTVAGVYADMKIINLIQFDIMDTLKKSRNKGFRHIRCV